MAKRNVLTEKQKKFLAMAARMQLARMHYMDYVKLVHHGEWKESPHLKLICDAMDRIITGDTKRLMIFMPPRHGKSMAVTKTFPSYFLGKFPDKRVIEVSYGEELATEFGEANRNKINEFGKMLFGVSCSSSQSAKTNWNIAGHNGGMISVGYGGSITGKGADLLIIDDPIKNRSEADSETFRKHLYDEYQSSIYTRLHPSASIVLILTRWHEKDLAARLLHPDDRTAEHWEVLSLPCLCEDEKSDLLHRKKGEVKFNPLKTTTDLEQSQMDMTRAQTQQIKAQTAQLYIQEQVLQAEEIRAKLAADGEFDIETLLDDLPEEDILSMPEVPEKQQQNLENALQSDAKSGRIREDRKGWNTAENGEHFLIGEEGTIQGGFGGKFNGSTPSKTFSKKKPAKPKSVAPTPAPAPTPTPAPAPEPTPAPTQESHQTSAEYFAGADTYDQRLALFRDKLSESSGKKISKKQAEDMSDAAYHWSGGAYGDIRDASQDPKNATKESKKRLKDLESLIDASPKWNGGTVYRGVYLPTDVVSGYHIGETIDMKGPSSWSSEKSVAEKFSKAPSYKSGTSVVYSVPTAKKGTSIKHLSNMPFEDEVLVSSLAQYRIKDIKKGKGKKPTMIELEEIE
jgi:hypothetical protein